MNGYDHLFHFREEYEELLLAYSYSSTNSSCDRTSLMSPGMNFNVTSQVLGRF